jgi:antitoxin (DNA-binding transcriptional repressor) of toxin-antitoxin stability system
MPTVGLNELRTHLSAIANDVQRSSAHYTITDRGKPVALLSPLSSTQKRSSLSPTDSTEYLDDLARKVSEIQREPWSVADLTDELR